jgi:hypothetical protein
LLSKLVYPCEGIRFKRLLETLADARCMLEEVGYGDESFI